MAVEAGRAALTGGGAVERVVLVSRDLPLLESSNAAVLLAGSGTGSRARGRRTARWRARQHSTRVSSARPRTLIIGADLEPAGAAAILTAEHGLQVRTAARVARSLPVRTRKATGDVHDYGDPRLLHERGLVASLAAAWLDTPAAVAGVDHERAADLCLGDPPALPTTGASSSLFALAGMAERGTTGPLVAVEQAILSGITVSGGTANDPPQGTGSAPDAGRAGSSPTPTSRSRWPPTSGRSRRRSVGRQDSSPTRDELDFPPRYRVAADGALATDYELVPLPRTGTVYTETTVHIPVPGLRTPYSLVIVELDGVGVRALVKVTGADAGHGRHRGPRPTGAAPRRRALRSPGLRLRVRTRAGVGRGERVGSDRVGAEP